MSQPKKIIFFIEKKIDSCPEDLLKSFRVTGKLWTENKNKNK
jgi:hypothetical protein